MTSGHRHIDRYRRFACGHWRWNNTLSRGGCRTCHLRRCAEYRRTHPKSTMSQSPRQRPGPTPKTHSAYAKRQAQRFKDQGYKLPEIASRMGITQHDVRQLLKPETPVAPTRFELVTVQPIVRSEAESGRSYSQFPPKRRSA